jgi:peptidyl-prolyl cis-trans isomerase C
VRPFALALILAMSCNQAPAGAPEPGAFSPTGEVLTTVDGHPVTQGMVDAMMTRLPPQVRQQLEESGQLSQVKDQLVMSELLYRAALTANLHNDVEIQTTIALAAREALAQAQLDAIIEKRADDAAVQKWYTDHMVQFARPQVKARHILVKDEAEIREVATKLAAGQTFAAMAKAHSKDPGSADKGGLLGWFKKDDMVKPFSDTAFATEKGQTSAPFQTRFGWHIVQIDDKRDAQPLDEVREQIVDTMSKEIVTAYIDELKAGAQIEDATAAATAGADAAKSGADAAK